MNMPVGLEETIGGTKVATDLVYVNTFQYPEKNSRITNFQRPAVKSAIKRRPALAYSRPKLDSLQQPDTPNLYCLTKQSVESLIKNGSLKQTRLSHFDLDIYQPVAHLQHVPPSISRPQSREQSFVKQPIRQRAQSAKPRSDSSEERIYRRQLISGLNLSVQGF